MARRPARPRVPRNTSRVLRLKVDLIVPHGAAPLFGPDSRAFFQTADQFPLGITRAEATRVLAIRAGFLAALVTDPRIAAAFARWWREAVALAEHVAGHPGSRRTMPPLDFDALLEEVAVPRPWQAWVGIGLLHTFNRMLMQGVADPTTALPPDEEVAVIAPEMARLFVVEIGESTENVRARLRVMVNDIEAELTAAERSAEGDTARRRGPKTDPMYLHTWGRWVYERRVRRPPTTLTTLARAYHETKGHLGLFADHDCRTHVRDGVREAERLLARAVLVVPAPRRPRRNKRRPTAP